MPALADHYPAVIIGAGQAGLAAAHTLAARGFRPWLDFLVLDANDGPGGAWRHRWDSLTLGKSHGIADLPGMPMGDFSTAEPSSRVVARYYGDYEAKFELPVLRPAKVSRVTSPDGELAGPLRIEFDHDGPQSVTADVLLNATGTWDSPFVPYVKGAETFRGEQLHTVHYKRAEDFAGKRTLVVGGGLSAVQFLLELAPVTETLWATRRPPNFTSRGFDSVWGLDVEKAVRDRTHAGERPASVVLTTGIPLWGPYVEAAEAGVLVSRGMFDEITPGGVRFGEPASHRTDGLGPAASDEELVLPHTWQPFSPGHHENVDVIFWNTGFRAALNHLSPLNLRTREGGVQMLDEVRVASDPRVLLVGYGSTASTIGATRAGRRAGRAAARILQR